MTSAKDIRAWMAGRQRPFQTRQMCEALGIPAGKERDRIRWTVQDFLKRGEIAVCKRDASGKVVFYRYNHAWRPKRPRRLKARILKAMYVQTGRAFTSSDIQRLSGARDRSFVNKTIRDLFDQGHLVRLEKRLGTEYVYRVADRERFRIEILD